MDIVGKLPLPHYITKELEDGSLYQTEYAKILGSSAAPTAGLHFTHELMEKLQDEYGENCVTMYGQFGAIIGTHVGRGAVAVISRIKG